MPPKQRPQGPRGQNQYSGDSQQQPRYKPKQRQAQHEDQKEEQAP